MTTTTTTTYRGVQGEVEGDVVAFRGVPYAQPPVGALRFAPPQRPDSWNRLRDAATFGPPAMQAANAIMLICGFCRPRSRATSV
jgi:para-nitrobenzyl esterase